MMLEKENIRAILYRTCCRFEMRFLVFDFLKLNIMTK